MERMSAWAMWKMKEANSWRSTSPLALASAAVCVCLRGGGGGGDASNHQLWRGGGGEGESDHGACQHAASRMYSLAVTHHHTAGR
jgi:hypothetical protein